MRHVKEAQKAMQFKVVAKRYGDSVEFSFDASNTKAALATANDIFGYKAGDAGAPTVSVKPVPEE